MKRFTLITMIFLIGLCFSTTSFSADRTAIEKAVSKVAIDGTFTDEACKACAPEGLYLFVMKQAGELVVHPKKDAIKNLNAPKYQVIYDELIKATPTGTWVTYQWGGKQKNTFVQKSGDYIVGCGY